MYSIPNPPVCTSARELQHLKQNVHHTVAERRRLQRALNESTNVAKETNPSKRQRASAKKKEHTEISDSTIGGENITILTAKDLLNDYKEDLGYIDRCVESVYMSDVNPQLEANKDSTESKYLYTWDMLDKNKQQAAYKKAIEAYDNHKSWVRGSELTDSEYKSMKYKHYVGPSQKTPEPFPKTH